MGFKSAPRCLSCLAAALEQPPDTLCARITGYVQRRECYRGAWNWATAAERAEPAAARCRFIRERTGASHPLSMQAARPDTHSSDNHQPAHDAERPAPSRQGAGAADHTEARTPNTVPAHSDSEWDAGDMACGDLVLALRLRLQAMPPRRILKLSARDPGAPEDLPAWCRLTGHTLLRAAHPHYWIQRKD